MTSFINEHRKVIVLFARFDNLDYEGDSEAGKKLQHYFSQVIDIVHGYGGYLNKIDMGDKGSKYIVVFGAPIAYEDDVERALHCALELQGIPDFQVQIGINSGYVYCGLVGSVIRQEYTVMGDVVNLSARLMEAAKRGEILISEGTYSESEGFTWTDLPTIQVKGKSAPVLVYALKGGKKKNVIKLQEPQYSMPMVGRVFELGVAEKLLKLSKEGRGQILGVTADAGMGKSRLSAEIIRVALENNFHGFGGECVSHGTKISYLVWQTYFGHFLI
ncbi:MAG: adenylate/guanylate cyclase domain-containing protein [Anaerolineae bacterium]|nr:adenylate/guanylate cyclase domain-containing protein [Anaerolineae bacterium]